MFKSGKTKIAILFLLSIAILSVSLFAVFGVAADRELQAHTPIVSITPDIANCGEDLNEFSVNVANTAGFGIYNVKIYKAQTNIEDVICGDAPSGWAITHDPDALKFGLYCEYETDPEGNETIISGNNLDFTFEATINRTECTSKFRVSTLDNEAIITGSGNGTEKNTFPELFLDCSIPRIDKMIVGPHVKLDQTCDDTNMNSNEGTCDFWISDETSLNIWAFDEDSPLKCDLGLDFCEWRVVLDGIPGEWQEEPNGEGIHWDVSYEEDSNHQIEIRCIDIAGNEAFLTELDKVDKTPPQTTKKFLGPQKIEDGVEWIDSVTQIELISTDPDPSGMSCNIGVDKLWYGIFLSDSINPCLEGNTDEIAVELDGGCFPYIDSPYLENKECINSAQDICEVEFDQGTVEWYNCVEEFVDEECNLDPEWKLYRGEPIGDIDESCHIMQYFAIDHLGNEEDMQVNCFFVDKTPPIINKEVGEPKVSCESIGDDSCDYYVTNETEIWLSCQDQEPHPSNDVTIHWRTRFDSEGNGLDDDSWSEFSEKSNEVHFTFQEESMHELEYWCVDAVNKSSEHFTEIDKVDPEPPIITKKMLGVENSDWLGQCPPRPGTEDKCYVANNGIGGIEVWVEDPEPNHASGVDFCIYEVEWMNETIDSGEFNEHVNITFNEDSTHTVTIWCQDRIGNTVTDVEVFLVDSNPPTTTKTYGEPLFTCVDWCEIECGDYTLDTVDDACMDICIEEVCSGPDSNGHLYPQWINSETEITLNSTDEKSGTDKIFWRNTIVDDIYCQEVEECQPLIDDESPFTMATGSSTMFTKVDQSCHLIEYYSVDKLGNKEELNWQCVFVDNTPPEGRKEVGEHSIFLGEDGVFLTMDDSVSPSMLDLELSPGESYSVKKSVTTGELAVADAEIYFLVDTTGSMGSVISTVKTNIDSVLDSVDAKFGAGQYKDFPNDPFAFQNDQIITDTKNNVKTAINAMFASGGSDGSEGQFFALQKIAESNAGFSNDSTRIVVWFGDAPGHDPICKEISGEADDITESSLIDALKDAGITVIAISTTTGFADELDDDPTSSASDYSGTCDILGSAGQATRIASATGGIHLENVAAANITDAIISAIGEVTATTDVVADASECISAGLEMFYDPEKHTNVSGSTTVMFNETITLPLDDAGEPIHCSVHFRSGERGGIIGSQHIWINDVVDDSLDWLVTKNTPITLSCVDSEPHPVGHEELCFKVSYEDPAFLTEEYCEYYDGNMDGDFCCLMPPFEFSFLEDSIHDLEFTCRDALGNTNVPDLEFFAVETVPPVTTKTFTGPHFEFDGVEYIDTETRVNLDAVDPQPHPSGVHNTYYQTHLVEDDYCWSEDFCSGWKPSSYDSDWTEYDGEFPIEEKSCHVIEYYSDDNLWNMENVSWDCVFVDKTAPQINKSFEGPHFTCDQWCESEGLDSESCLEMCEYSEDTNEWFPQWISDETKVIINVEDPEDHPSGVKSVSYRSTLVDDENCRSISVCQNNATGSGDFQTLPEDGQFMIIDESCHLIEVMAVDNVDKTTIHKQCVFVDTSAPVPNKTVGEPKTPWDGKDAFFYELDEFCDTPGNCWKVTLFTPISLMCSDPEPHPVNHENVCFMVEVDGDDYTENYCNLDGIDAEYNKSGEGWCCTMGEPEFYFNEVSEHNLKYYCEDALGNKGPIDDEKFKVEETKFSIWLNKKWNLISVPVKLLDNSMDLVFADLEEEVESVWQFDGTNWHIYTPDGIDNDDVTTMEPGWGYWILANNETELIIGGSLFNAGPITPPNRPVVAGWNLLGYYGVDGPFCPDDGCTEYHGPVGKGDYASCAFNTLGVSLWDKGFTSLQTYWEPDNPESWKPLGKNDYLDPGAGYWLFAQEEGIYAPSTTCGGLII